MARLLKLFHPAIPDGRTWRKLGKHGEYGENGEHGELGKCGKHYLDVVDNDELMMAIMMIKVIIMMTPVIKKSRRKVTIGPWQL